MRPATTSRGPPPRIARESPLERALHRAQPGLDGPAAKMRPVVGDVEPDAHSASLVAAHRQAQGPGRADQTRLGELFDERLHLRGDVLMCIHTGGFGGTRGELSHGDRILQPLPDERGRATERGRLGQPLVSSGAQGQGHDAVAAVDPCDILAASQHGLIRHQESRVQQLTDGHQHCARGIEPLRLVVGVDRSIHELAKRGAIGRAPHGRGDAAEHS